MKIKEYQKKASRTLVQKDSNLHLSEPDLMLVWNAIGLFGEVGEVVEHIKKGIFHKHGLNNSKLTEELGDVLWYLSALCTLRGISLEDVMINNIKKLEKRYPLGYSDKDSKARFDEEADDKAQR